jgi:integrase
MRASEIGALEADSLLSLRIDGEQFWYLKVKDSKTKAGKRDVPIHPGLAKLGFIDYCIERSGRSGRLFEEWTRPRGKKLSEARVIRNFNDIICKEMGYPGNRPTFHCFRHTMQSALIEAELPRPMRKAILGHKQDEMEASYYKPVISNYVKPFCERVQFRDLDLTHLRS